MAVLDQVKKERSTERVEVQDIIRAEIEQSGGDFNKVFSSLAKKIKDGKTRILRSGNSLLIYNILGPGIAEVHISTLDKPKELVKAVKEFYESMKIAGFKKAITKTENPLIGKVLSMAGVPVKVRQKPDASGRQVFELLFGV
jgi:hypothetical protein